MIDYKFLKKDSVFIKNLKRKTLSATASSGCVRVIENKTFSV